MTLPELKKLSLPELLQEIAKNQHVLYKMQLDVHTDQSKAVHKLRETRKYIAQLNTFKTAIEKTSKLTA